MIYADLQTTARFALDSARRLGCRYVIFQDAIGYGHVPVTERAVDKLGHLPGGFRVVAVVAPSGACHFVEAC